MLVLSIEDKPNVSKKNGLTYHSYAIKYGVKRNYEVGEVIKEYSTTLNNSRDIEKLIKEGKIKTYKDLEGREIMLFRAIPVFLSDYEKKWNVIQADTLILLK